VTSFGNYIIIVIFSVKYKTYKRMQVGTYTASIKTCNDNKYNNRNNNENNID